MVEQSESAAQIVALPLLIDYLVQKSYHDLLVLSELLPRKSDVDRKTSIYQFASRTHQQFVRLLGLVKWAAKAARVDKCTEIRIFLDKQSSLFVDTADSLSTVARDSLVHASFPAFGLASAVDVLVTGTYNRLPSTIKDKILPDDTITDEAKDETLDKLTTLIQQRLVLSKIPTKFKTVEMGNGYVTLSVPHEFSVRLTVPNDDFKHPWRMLSLDINIQNPIEEDPRPPVHAFQKQYLTELLQSRLFDPTEEPLVDLCNAAHTFCVLLQMEILYTQAVKLCNGVWKNKVSIIEYFPDKVLTLAYWRGSPHLGAPQALLVVYCPDGDHLRVDHRPDLAPQGVDTSEVQIDFEDLSIEALLMGSIDARSQYILKKFHGKLEQEEGMTVEVWEGQQRLQAKLYTKITLTIHLELMTGTLFALCSHNVSLAEFITAANKGTELPEALNKIRMRVELLNLTNYSLNSLAITHHTWLALTNRADYPLLVEIDKAALYIRFKNVPQYCVVVGLQKKEYQYLLVKLESSSKDDKPSSVSTVTACTEISSLDIFSIVDLTVMEPVDVILLTEKAILYIMLQEEWKKKGQRCLGVVPLSDTAYCLRLLSLPTSHPLLKSMIKDLTIHLTSMNPITTKYCLEFNTDSPLLPDNINGKMIFTYPTNIRLALESFSSVWKGINHLFNLVHTFQSLKNTSLGQIKKYTFNMVVVEYEVDGCSSRMSISWQQNRYRLTFYQLASGCSNPHTIIKSHLEQDLNVHQCIFRLLASLHRTSSILHLYSTLPTNPVLGLEKNFAVCKKVWSYIPHSTNSYRLIYRTAMALDVVCYDNERYGLVDGATMIMTGDTRSRGHVGYSKIYLLNKFLDSISKKVEGATVETVATPTHVAEGPAAKYAAYSPQPATPNRPVPSPASIAQPSPQPPFMQPIPSPLGAPSPALMSMMSPQTPQYMPPSPAMVPSPGGYIQQASPGSAQHILGSPQYRNPNTGPGSYSIVGSPSGPSKAQAHRLYRSSSTLIVNKVLLDAILSYSTIEQPGRNKGCMLENLLSISLLKRQICLNIPETRGIRMRSNDIMTTSIEHESCQYRFSIDPNTLQSINLSIIPTRDGIWNKQMIDTICHYFTLKIAGPPYKANAVISFLRILGGPPSVLHLFVQMMSLELRPDPLYQWQLTWCPCIPPEAPRLNELQPGMAGCIFTNTKILFFIRLDHPHRPNNPVIIPIVYEPGNNNIKRAEIQPLDTMSQRVTEQLRRSSMQYNEQGMGAALRDLICNLDPSL